MAMAAGGPEREEEESIWKPISQCWAAQHSTAQHNKTQHGTAIPGGASFKERPTTGGAEQGEDKSTAQQCNAMQTGLMRGPASGQTERVTGIGTGAGRRMLAVVINQT